MVGKNISGLALTPGGAAANRIKFLKKFKTQMNADVTEI